MFDLTLSNILHSNLFNFVIMVVLFAIIFHKMNVKKKLDDAHKGEKQIILDSDSEKEKSIFALKEVKNSVKNLGNEIETIYNDGKKIIADLETNVQLEIKEIEQNFNKHGEKMLEVEDEKARYQARIELAKKSVEVAENKLNSALLEDIKLHKKFIADAIDELDEIEIK